MNNPVGLLSKLTEALANLSIQAVLIAIGAMLAALALAVPVAGVVIWRRRRK